ncbi:acyl transferase [Leptospira perolatii]|uniref:Acyl transferase n=1 Tax=Leptospira perolatii TaxID=2023191 RepID=A0A2M9ZQS6_9LEPT|nr:acyl transferase [Leptospira perolatii]PJZ70485.1 acyl transferase [Leptospira perolatii]PJZ74321.1 acyl transferase [Leptospira perolatii]
MILSNNLQVKSFRDRNIALWSDIVLEPRNHSVLICGGFSRRMSGLGSLAAYLLTNGSSVYRFDYLDHVGLSDGVIRNFTIESFHDSLTSVLEKVADLENGKSISILAVSLGAVPAIQLSVDNSMINGIGCLVGVVDPKTTFERVFGTDYYDWRFEDLPETIRFEGYDIDPRGLWTEQKEKGSANFSLIKSALEKLSCPIVNLVASEDQWLTMSEVREAFSVPGGGRREIVELPYGGHELSRNPLALRLAMRHIIARLLYDGNLEMVEEPSFDEIGDLRVSDRKRARSSALLDDDIAPVSRNG